MRSDFGGRRRLKRAATGAQPSSLARAGNFSLTKALGSLCALARAQILLSLLIFSSAIAPFAALAQQRATITVDLSHPINRFRPAQALGGAIDGHDKGTNDIQLLPPNIQAMLSAGLKSLTYRLRTELAGDAWHWNPHGSWSEEQNRRGYWTSDSELTQPISLSYGYRLPRRGNTIDQANDDSYSRIDDDNPQTFWKSDPYLDQKFTKESNVIHPQWIVVEFEKPKSINAVRILWGEPFATCYRVQYGNFDDVSDIALNPAGTWLDFPAGREVSAKVLKNNERAALAVRTRASALPVSEQDVLLRVSRTPIKARWLRILMTESAAGGCDSRDIRDCVGFAVRELFAGVIDAKGEFHDQIHHAADRHKQTIIHVSSTDPWHSESDLDKGVEQVGLDRIYQIGLTNDLPMLLPTGLVYDTPENAANEIRYLRARGYKFERVELGEEPDGQYISPEDFGALYLQWVDAIRRVDPNVKIGGPSFQEILYDKDTPGRGNSVWLRRFLEYLKRRGRSSDYSFFSFEWYPFDDVCEPVAPQLARAPMMLEQSLREMQRRGLSRRIPWIISEYGYSAYATRAEITIEGAILNADIVGKFLSLGGSQAFLFGYTPGYVNRDFPCTAGNNMLFSLGDDGLISDRFATYFGARLVTQEWLKPGDEMHELYRASSSARNPAGLEWITAYAVRRPDGQWSVLLLNKNPNQAYDVSLSLRDVQSHANRRFSGKLELIQYSSKQYVLGGPADDPRPTRAEEPERKIIEKPKKFSLPPYSITVLRGGVE